MIRKHSYLQMSLIALLVLALGLTGCGSMAFSPQQAAIRGALDTRPAGSVVDENSVQVRQTVTVGGITVVAVTYNRLYDNRNEQCTMTYEVRRSPLGGWMPGSGGGGCSSQIGGEPEQRQPLEVGAGISSGSGPNEPGFSQVYGLVNQEDIDKVLVTWEDATQQEVDVVNGTYVALRIGQLEMTSVEGLNASGNVVYKFDRADPAPGKQ